MKKMTSAKLAQTHGARTPLFAALRRALGLAQIANQRQAPPVDEVVAMADEARWTRRQFLKSSAAAGVLLGSGGLGSLLAPPPPSPALPRRTALDPRIAIVGAGIAGLNAAYKLKQAGVRATVYEGSGRIGGRMYTGYDVLAPGLATELGAEFIDSGHTEMHALVAELGLELMDTKGPSEETFVQETYVFGGRRYSEAEVVAAFRPVAARMQADYDSIGEVVDFQNDGGAGELDRTTLADYLVQVGATGWLRQMIEVAYVTEYGLDSDQQSALNLLFLIGLDVSDGFHTLGESDERYKVRGGNQQVPVALAQRLEGQLRLEHRLEAITTDCNGYRLTFAQPNGAVHDVSADIVLLALPFSLLREVALRVALPPWKHKAIDEVTYGTNAKLMLGFERRVWRDLGFGGNAYSDQPYQSCWDNSRLQNTVVGGLTLYSGGQPGVAVGQGTPQEQAARMLPGVNQTFPGAAAAFTGQVVRFHWPTYPWTKGSYTSYAPGQWTTIHGAEILPVGNLFFAGEHCSYQYQGYMNGGAETGATAAGWILEQVGIQNQQVKQPTLGRRELLRAALSPARLPERVACPPQIDVGQ